MVGIDRWRCTARDATHERTARGSLEVDAAVSTRMGRGVCRLPYASAFSNCAHCLIALHLLVRVEDVPVIRDEDGMMIEPPPFLKQRAYESDAETVRPSSPPPSTCDSETGDCDMEDGEVED